MRPNRPALALAILLLAVSGAPAQEPPDAPAVDGAPAPQTPAEGTDGAPAPGDADAAPTTAPTNAPFMAPLERLASILGSVHFLRTLCGDPEAAVWRTKMNDLLAAQAPNDADRRRLVSAFNGGYRAYETTYRSCTPPARLAVDRFQAEGADLSREISTRYGN